MTNDNALINPVNRLNSENILPGEIVLKRGYELREKGEIQAAIEEYKKASLLYRDRPEFFHELANSLLMVNQLENALRYCQDSLKINGNYPLAYLTLGNIFYFQNKHQQARNAYEQMIKLEPNFPQAYANLGSLDYLLGDYENAAKFYQKALEINPNLPSVQFMLGNTYTQQEQWEEGIICYEKALMLQPNDSRIYFKLGESLGKIERLDAGISCLSKSLELNPQDVQVRETLNRFVQIKKQQERRENETPNLEGGVQPEQFQSPSQTHLLNEFTEGKLTRELMTGDPLKTVNETPILSLITTNLQPESMGETLRKQGENYLQKGQIQEAIVMCQQAVKAQPDLTMGYVTLGNSFYAAGKYESALRSYFQALEIQPDFAEVQANIGSMYLKLGQMETARQWYEKALVLNPHLGGIYWNLAKIYQDQGNQEDAINYYLKTAEYDPKIGGAEFYFNLGNNLFNRHRFQDSITCYEKALQVNPNWAEVYGNLGTSKNSLGLSQEAITYYKKALELKPELSTLHFNLANALFLCGQHQAAINHYKETIKNHPDWPEIYGNLGNVCALTGHLSDAIASYEKAIELKPDWAEIYCRLGHIKKQDTPLESITLFEKAIELKPDFSEAYQQLADLLSHSTNLAGARRVADQYYQFCGDQQKVISGTSYIFAYLQSGVSDKALEKLIEIEKYCHENAHNFTAIELKFLYEIFLFSPSHLRDDLEGNANFYKLIAQEYYQKAIPKRELSFPPKLTPPHLHQRELRIGFISKHFRRHSVGWCSESVIRELSNITPYINLYVTGKVPYDEVSQRFDQIGAKFYIPTKYPNGFPDAGELLDEIGKDRLDILVDLDSMTVPTNMEIMYYEPASLQVSWLGFDAPYMSPKHYLLCDQYTHPQGMEKHYIERLVRLPHGSVAITPFSSRPVDTKSVRKNLGIGLDEVVFLCVSSGRKTNRESVRAQVTILKEVPESILIRKGQGDPNILKELYAEECDHLNIDKNRIKFIGQTKTEEEHRGIYHVADVMLDSYPYNGGTHNLEALSANLPVITRVGNQYLSRMGYAFLKSANIHEGIAHSWDEYIELGIKFGRNLDLRNMLREHLIRSKQPESLEFLWNPKQLAQDMYEAFQELLINHS